MSYILSALRKAESQRKSSEWPTSENFLTDGGVGNSSGGSAINKWAIGVLSLLLMASLAYLYLARLPDGFDRSKDSLGENSADAQLTVNQDDGLANSGDRRAVEESAYARTDSLQSTRTAGVSEPDQRGSTPLSQHVESSLPRDQVPPMPNLNITGYIYFESQPARSKLFVDGIVYRQESRLAEGLTLKEFAKDFVTVSYYGAEQRVYIR